MFSSVEHALRSFDIQQQFVTLNANAVPFQNDLRNNLLGYGRWTNIEPTVGNKVGPMSKMTSN